MMRDAGATVIVMDATDDECQRRLKQRFVDETMNAASIVSE